MAFEGLSDRLDNAFKKLKSKGSLTESDVRDAMREVRLALLEADVNYKVAKDFTNAVTERAIGAKVMESLTPAQMVIKIVNEELIALMGGTQAKITISPKPPTVIMMTGLQGAGKTTLVNLLLRFYEVNGGRILVDGVDITKMNRADLRSKFGMVLQDTWLFHGTVFENIAYGKEGATLEEVQRVAKAARIHSYISHLPEGYDTVLSDDGINISKGQRQLITIARAMLSDAPMLILDEATSNVDTRTEIRIQKAMEKLMEGKTCFIIAHRLSTIQHADNIILLSHGQIMEQGSHDELMAKEDGIYRTLYDAQFSGRLATEEMLF